MKGLSMMLAALGIKLTDEQIALISRELPALPQRIQEAGIAIAGSLKNFDERLRVLETCNNIRAQENARILEMLENISTTLGATNESIGKLAIIEPVGKSNGRVKRTH